MRDFINIAGDGNVGFHASESPTVQLGAFALGYRDAARILVNHFSADGHSDYEGYPILYLYRHVIELYLKALVFRGASFLGLLARSRPETKRLFQHHEFRRLVPPLRTIFATMEWDLDEAGFGSFDEFEGFLNTLDELDAGSDTFRYPLDRAGAIATSSGQTINVIVFAQVCDPLLDYLEGAVDIVDEDWKTTAELQHDMRDYFEWDDEA